MLKFEEIYKFIDKFEKSGLKIASVAAMTGTGKSTVIPSAFYQLNRTIMVIQPTITASVGIANYLKKSIPENDIGTAAEGEKKYQNKILYESDTITTPLVYCTAGHLRNIMLKYAETPDIFSEPFVDYIFLDEAHTGDLQYDLIMYIYQYLLNKINPDILPRLLLVTATPGKYPFDLKKIFNQVYPGKSYPVDIIYHDKDYSELKGKEYETLFQDLISVVSNDHRNIPVPEEENDGWLIFCPGKKEIDIVCEKLRVNTHGTIIIPLYSGMSEDSIDFNMEPPIGIRKIVVATNVAEASITIDGLTRVYDTLVEKTTIESKNGGIMLSIVNIAKASAAQRKGRAGRVKPGSCYRMCTEKYFNNLEEIRKREIERISPDGMILDLLSRNLKIEDIIIDNVISRSKLDNTLNRLKIIKLIEDDKVTKAGLWVKNTTLSPRVGMFLWIWSIFSNFDPFIGALFASILENHNGGFFNSVDKEKESISVKVKKNFPNVVKKLRDDPVKSSFRFNIYLLLDILNSFKTLNIPSHTLKQYCKKNHLNNQKIKDTLKLTEKLTMKFYQGKQLRIGNFDVNYNVELALPILHQCYGDLSFKNDNKRYKFSWELDIESKKQNILPFSTFDVGFLIFVSMYEPFSKLKYLKI